MKYTITISDFERFDETDHVVEFDTNKDARAHAVLLLTQQGSGYYAEVRVHDSETLDDGLHATKVYGHPWNIFGGQE